MMEKSLRDSISSGNTKQLNKVARSYIKHPPDPSLSPLSLAFYKKSLEIEPYSRHQSGPCQNSALSGCIFPLAGKRVRERLRCRVPPGNPKSSGNVHLYISSIWFREIAMLIQHIPKMNYLIEKTSFFNRFTHLAFINQYRSNGSVFRGF